MDLAGDIVQPIKMTNQNVQIQFEGTVFNVPIMPANAFEAEKLMPEKPKEVKFSFQIFAKRINYHMIFDFFRTWPLNLSVLCLVQSSV